MDRITDSGSVDWGSTPHGHTERPPSRFFYTPCFTIHYSLLTGQRIFPVGGRGCQEYSVASLNIKNLMSPTPLN